MWASAAGQGEIRSAVWQSTAVSLVFGVTLSLSAALLFSVQPMVARMLLPLLGGAPAVWNTCLIAVHISNRYLRLAPVLAALARDAGVVAAVRDDWNVSAELLAIGKTPSAWAAFARDTAGIGALARVNPGWQIIEPLPGAAPWTDDYANILSALAL